MKYLYIIAGLIAGVLLSYSTTAYALSTFQYSQGGTGTTTASIGQLIYGGNTAYQSVATTSVSCTGGTTCSAFTIIGSSPITINSSVGGGTGLSSTTPWTAGQLSYVINNSTLASIATTTLGVSGPFLLPSTGALVGGSNTILTWTGLATTTAITSNQLLYSTSASGVSSVATSSLGVTGPITFSGTIGSQVGGAGGNFGCATCALTTRALTVAGTANQITSSAGAQDLSADRTWTLSLPNHVIFPLDFVVTNATTTNATTTTLYFTGLASSGLGVDATGKVYAAATSTLSNISGTLAITSGGTGVTSLTADQILYTTHAATGVVTAASSTLLGVGTLGQVWGYTGAGGGWVATSTGGGSGTVTSIIASIGLSGGTITTTGTIGLLSYLATSSAETSGQLPFWTSTNGTPANLSGGSNKFFWDNAMQTLGVGTSTPRAALTVASSTGAQILLTDGLSSNAAPWYQRAIAGNFFFGTSSPTTFATSTNPIFSIIPSSTVNATTTWNLTDFLVKQTSATAFMVNDFFGTNVVQVNTASTTGNVLQVMASTTNTTLFAIDQLGMFSASSTAPTLSSGQIDGTNNGGVVTNCSSVCTITFAKGGFPKTPECTVFEDNAGLVNAISIARTATSLAVTQTGLGTFSFHCGVGL